MAMFFSRLEAKHLSRRHNLFYCGSYLIHRGYGRFSPAEAFGAIIGKTPERQSAEEAVSFVNSGDVVYSHGLAATPSPLLAALAEHAKEKNMKDIEVMTMLEGLGPETYTKPEYAEFIRSNSLFMGSYSRKAVRDGRADNIPILLSEIPLLFRRGICKPTATFVHVTPPDKHGFCSLGTAVEAVRAAMKHSSKLIGLVNKNVPRTYGDTLVHITRFDSIVEEDIPVPQLPSFSPSQVDLDIGQLISDNLVSDGATIQAGIGAIPDIVLSKLKQHKDLGIHTETMGDGVVDLVAAGKVSNAKKLINTGKIVTSIVLGTKKVYDFIDENPFLEILDVGYTNDVSVIRSNPKVTAINTCLEIDITGQVASESVGTQFYSGFGGQIDFLRGAATCENYEGKAILAVHSTTNKGESKIVPLLKKGAGVVATRAHAHYIVTEYGIAYLHGKNYRQRAYELIQIAHPDHRETLEKAAFKD